MNKDKLQKTLKKKSILIIFLKKIIHCSIDLFQIFFLSFYKDKEVINLIKKIKKENQMLLYYDEAYSIYSLVKSLAGVKGDIAEVGAFRGASAKLICEAKGEKKLHLFDTFSGLPQTDTKIDNFFSKGQFSSDYEFVKYYLKNYKNVYLYKGFFPDTAGPVKQKRFSFVHLDVDIYKSTKDALCFFYPRMNSGGVIITHDYAQAQGVKNAFDEFFQNKSEIIIELPNRQCLVVKL